MKKFLLLSISVFGLLTINPARSMSPEPKSWIQMIVSSTKMTCVFSPIFTGLLCLAEPKFRYSATQSLIRQGKTVEEVTHIIASQQWPLSKTFALCSLGTLVFSLWHQLN